MSLNICFLELSEKIHWELKQIQISHGKQASGVWAIEIWLQFGGEMIIRINFFLPPPL